MHIRFYYFIICILIAILCDAGCYYVFKNRLKAWMKWLYWMVCIVVIGSILALPLILSKQNVASSTFVFSRLLPFYLLFYIPRILFLLLYSIQRLSARFTHESKRLSVAISGIFCILLFFITLHGVTIGRSDYKMRTTELTYKELPKAFDGFTIIHLSDLHLGSLSTDFQGIQKLVDMVNRENPDIIVFTGDMVNFISLEMKPWIPVLAQLKAKYGVFASTGNHDYGLYQRQWDFGVSKEQNIVDFQTYMKDAGFTMLNNTNKSITIDRQSISIVGVEDWGNPPYPKYGDLKKALQGTNDRFVVLLSHDPSHWKAEAIQQKIPLTLAGHTHAMQMGIQIGTFQWSPAKILYPEYDGLYEKDGCKIIISRGQGYLGYPGRLGLRPQLDKIILRSAN